MLQVKFFGALLWTTSWKMSLAGLFGRRPPWVVGIFLKPEAVSDYDYS